MNKKMQKIVPIITIVLMLILVIFFLNKAKMPEQISSFHFKIQEEK